VVCNAPSLLPPRPVPFDGHDRPRARSPRSARWASATFTEPV